MNYAGEIRKYLKKEILNSPASGNEQNSFQYGFMQKRIPEEFITEDLKKSGRINLTLEGEGFLAFKEIIKNLRNDKLTEHLKDKDLEERFWYLLCEVYFHKSKYNDGKLLNSLINEFLKDIRKPFKDYELVFSISNLKLDHDQINFWDTNIISLDENAWNSMSVSVSKFTEFIAGMKIEKEFIGKTIMILKMQGNNAALVASRARERAQAVLRALQVYLRTNMGVQDEELLFELSEFYLIRDAESVNKWYSGWNKKRTPRVMTINKKLSDSIIMAEKHHEFIQTTKPSLRDRIERSIYWAGMSVEEAMLDHKLVYLCTALESLLTAIDDKRKGEAITYRMVVVNHIVEMKFPEPFKLMAFYELRSKVVHGASLFETTSSDYSVMHYMARKTIFNFIALCEKFDVKSYSDFLKIIHKDEYIDPVIRYFKKFKGPWPEDILSSIGCYKKVGIEVT